MDNKLTVEQMKNGFTCRCNECYDDGTPYEDCVVFEENEKFDDNWGRLFAMKRVLYYIKEHFGVFWSKHNKHNLSIQVIETETGKEVDE